MPRINTRIITPFKEFILTDLMILKAGFEYLRLINTYSGNRRIERLTIVSRYEIKVNTTKPIVVPIKKYSGKLNLCFEARRILIPGIVKVNNEIGMKRAKGRNRLIN
jgi:hypothetical protein